MFEDVAELVGELRALLVVEVHAREVRDVLDLVGVHRIAHVSGVARGVGKRFDAPRPRGVCDFLPQSFCAVGPTVYAY